MLFSLPVLSRVVMARVAMLRLWSLMRASMSMLQLVTAMGCDIATCPPSQLSASGGQEPDDLARLGRYILDEQAPRVRAVRVGACAEWAAVPDCTAGI